MFTKFVQGGGAPSNVLYLCVVNIKCSLMLHGVEDEYKNVMIYGCISALFLSQYVVLLLVYLYSNVFLK